jgi:hypothetical protein
LERARAATVREYSGGESLCVDAHMLVEHGLEYAVHTQSPMLSMAMAGCV